MRDGDPGRLVLGLAGHPAVDVSSRRLLTPEGEVLELSGSSPVEGEGVQALDRAHDWMEDGSLRLVFVGTVIADVAVGTASPAFLDVDGRVVIRSDLPRQPIAGQGWTGISSGGRCVWKETGEVQCVDDWDEPVAVPEELIRAGARYWIAPKPDYLVQERGSVCSLVPGGRVRCEGAWADLTPPGDGWMTMDANRTACAVHRSGEVACWGADRYDLDKPELGLDSD